MSHVHRYFTMGSDVVSPAYLVHALRTNSSVTNTHTKMIGINRIQAVNFDEDNLFECEKLNQIRDHL